MKRLAHRTGSAVGAASQGAITRQQMQDLLYHAAGGTPFALVFRIPFPWTAPHQKLWEGLKADFALCSGMESPCNYIVVWGAARPFFGSRLRPFR